MRRLLAIVPFLFAGLGQVDAQKGRETQIYIDQVPGYTSLRPCAQGRVSAIVRAQASGCGDNMHLTSFTCFCMQSSSQFVSILSTDIAAECAAEATAAPTSGAQTTGTSGNTARRVRARQTAAAVTAAPTATGAVAGDVASALAVFGSYCSKSTELTRFQQPQTITLAPSSTPTTSSAPLNNTGTGSKSNGKLIAAIVASTVGAFILLIAGVLFFLHRRRKQTRQNDARAIELDSHHPDDKPLPYEKAADDALRAELSSNRQRRLELGRNEKGVMSVYEMYQPPVELEAANWVPEKKRGVSEAERAYSMLPEKAPPLPEKAPRVPDKARVPIDEKPGWI